IEIEGDVLAVPVVEGEVGPSGAGRLVVHRGAGGVEDVELGLPAGGGVVEIGEVVQGDELLELVGGHGVVLEGEAAEVEGRSAGAEPLGGHVVENGPGAAAEVVVDLGAGEEDAAAADAGDELVAADGVLNESGGVSGVGVDLVLEATDDGLVPAVLE